MTIVRQTDCFSKCMKYWIFLGIYPFKVNCRFYAFYSKLVLFLYLILYNIFSTINFYFLPSDLDLFIEELMFYFTILSILSKVLPYVMMKKKIKEILKFLDSDLFQPKTENEIKIITAAKLFNEKYWNAVAVFSYFTHFAHIFFPLFIHLIFSEPVVFPVSSYLFLPEDYRTKYFYYIYCYQAVGIHMQMLCYLNLDTFFVGLMILLIAQLDILADKLKAVANSLVVEDDCSSDLQCIRKLNESIIHYYNIDKFCNLVEDTFSFTLFAQFSVASGIICICLFHFTLPALLPYYIFLGCYIFAVTIPILVPCYFGTRIMDKSEQLSNAVYDCDWTSRSRRFKSSMMLFVERANRPLSITGLKMFPLSLTTFTSIMKSAYSFFSLLQQVKTKET